MKRLRKTSLSINGSRWLRHAERLARSIRRPYGTIRHIIEGCIVEGRRAGNNLVAMVTDPPTYILSIGPGPIADGDDFNTAIVTEFVACTVPFPRDSLHWRWFSTPLPVANSPSSRIYTWRQASLRVRTDRADNQAYYNAFHHGSVAHASGVYSTGYSSTVAYYTHSGSSWLTAYRTSASPTFYEFSFATYFGMPNTRFEDGQFHLGKLTVARSRGLVVDNEWVEAHIGGGLQVVMDWAPGGVLGPDNVAGTQWTQDSANLRWQYPWVCASPVEVTDTGILWQLCARVTTPPSDNADMWGARKLASFRVQTTASTDESGEPVVTAQPVGPVVIYDPLDSGGTRAPQWTGTRWDRNTFAAATSGPNGVMVVGQVVRTDAGGPLTDYFHAVLVTEGGDFVELDLPGLYRDVTWFAGGDEVDGVTYMLNPFLDNGQMAVVRGDTGETTLVERPSWRAPLDLPDVNPRGYYCEDILRNTVTHIGNGKLVFPAALGDGVSIVLGQYNVRTGESAIVGPMWSHAATMQRGGISKVGVVQYESEGYPDEEGSKPAILLSGFNNGSAPGRIATGWMYISYDSGASWFAISSIYGPARDIGVVGNGLYYPKPGRMWGSTSDD